MSTTWMQEEENVNKTITMPSSAKIIVLHQISSALRSYTHKDGICDDHNHWGFFPVSKWLHKYRKPGKVLVSHILTLFLLHPNTAIKHCLSISIKHSDLGRLRNELPCYSCHQIETLTLLTRTQNWEPRFLVFLRPYLLSTLLFPVLSFCFPFSALFLT